MFAFFSRSYQYLNVTKSLRFLYLKCSQHLNNIYLGSHTDAVFILWHYPILLKAQGICFKTFTPPLNKIDAQTMISLHFCNGQYRRNTDMDMCAMLRNSLETV